MVKLSKTKNKRQRAETMMKTREKAGLATGSLAGHQSGKNRRLLKKHGMELRKQMFLASLEKSQVRKGEVSSGSSDSSSLRDALTKRKGLLSLASALVSTLPEAPTSQPALDTEPVPLKQSRPIPPAIKKLKGDPKKRHLTGSRRLAIVQEEYNQFQNVLSNSAFIQNPEGALQNHLQNTAMSKH